MYSNLPVTLEPSQPRQRRDAADQEPPLCQRLEFLHVTLAVRPLFTRS